MKQPKYIQKPVPTAKNSDPQIIDPRLHPMASPHGFTQCRPPVAGRRVLLEALHRLLDQGLLPLQRGFQDLHLHRAQGHLAGGGRSLLELGKWWSLLVTMGQMIDDYRIMLIIMDTNDRILQFINSDSDVILCQLSILVSDSINFVNFLSPWDRWLWW